MSQPAIVNLNHYRAERSIARAEKCMELVRLVDACQAAHQAGDYPAAFSAAADAQKLYEDLYGDTSH